MTKRKTGTAPRAGRPSTEKPGGTSAEAAAAGAAPAETAGDGARVAVSGAAGTPGGAPTIGAGPALGAGPTVGGGSAGTDAGTAEPRGRLTKPQAGAAQPQGGSAGEQAGAVGSDAASAGPQGGVAASRGGVVEPQAGAVGSDAASAGPQGGVAAPQGGFTVPGVAPAEGRKQHLPGGPLDVAITVGGLVVAVLLAVALAVLEAFLAPLRASDLGLGGPGEGNMRIPLALVLALVTNPLLGWFAFTTTGRRFAALLPAGAWCVVWILAAGRTTEGDLLITNENWVGLLTLFTGPLAFAVGIYVSALRGRVAAAGNSKATPLAPQSVDG